MTSLRRGLHRVQVTGLLGTYDYDLELSAEAQRAGVSILYGENGTGKTTLLNLLFHVLSAAVAEGHRTATSRIRFKRLYVETASGDHITAEKTDPKATTFSQEVSLARGGTCRVDSLPEEHRNEAFSDKYTRMCELLRRASVSPKLLSHRRILSDDSRVASAVQRTVQTSPFQLTWPLVRTSLEDRAAPDPDDAVLNDMLESATRALAREAAQLRDSGMLMADRLYASLIERLALQPEEDPATLAEITGGLAKLAERSRTFSAFGLSPRVRLEETLVQLAALSPHSGHATVVAAMLKPYIADLTARFDALESLSATLTKVTSTLDNMLLNKTLTFSIEDGFSITQRRSGEPIPPTALSSGERQLLLLTCTALSSRTSKTLLLIDEPELSLNILWQRALIPLLQTCMGEDTSTVVATHSMEVLSQYRDTLLRLPRQSESIGEAAGSRDSARGGGRA